MGRRFVKMHGLRNHFVIVDGRADPYRPEIDEIVRICDAEIGIGADQLVVIETADNAEAFVRFFNVDGREVEACGNATRCVAWHLTEDSGADRIALETLAGVLECERAGNRRVRCGMGRVSMDWREIPLAEERDTCHLDIESDDLRDAVALNIGNPHVVFFVDDPDAVDLASAAPPIQRHALFPEEVNVGMAQMLSADRLRLAVYERGAGLTTACGSGACVAVYAALARGLTDSRSVTVEMPAGEVQIEIDDDGAAYLTGPVAYCFLGELNSGSEP